MKVTDNKFSLLDVVMYKGIFCQIEDVVAKRFDGEWYYDIHECFGDGEYCDIPESKIRDLNEEEINVYEYRSMV